MPHHPMCYVSSLLSVTILSLTSSLIHLLLFFSSPSSFILSTIRIRPVLVQPWTDMGQYPKLKTLVKEYCLSRFASSQVWYVVMVFINPIAFWYINQGIPNCMLDIGLIVLDMLGKWPIPLEIELVSPHIR